MPENKIIAFFIYLAAMAGVTYLLRLLPLLFVRHKIKSRFVRSFLYYVPYSVLTVMTVPAIFSSTACLFSALVGFAVAIVLACFKRSLLEVAASAVGAVLAAELVYPYLPEALQSFFAAIPL